MSSGLTALVLDFGGVLTNDFWGVLRSYARRDGLDENALVGLVTENPDGMKLLRSLERGDLSQVEFEAEMAARLGVPQDGLLARIAADLRPDEAMLDEIATLRAHGVRIAILSNSWGSDQFDPYEPWKLADRADVVIISDQVRMRKPEPAIFQFVVGELGVAANECVFVDDVAAYLEPAKALGMTVLHHTNAKTTISKLRILFSHFPALDGQATGSACE